MMNIEMRKITKDALYGGFIRKELFMSSVRRVYVEKKPDFAVQAKELKHEISLPWHQGCNRSSGVNPL